MPTEVQPLVDIVGIIARGGFIGAIISFMLEKSGWFQSISTGAKYWITFGLCLGLPFLAALAMQFIPVSVWAVLEPYWQALAAGFGVWLATQLVHNAYKGTASYRESKEDEE